MTLTKYIQKMAAKMDEKNYSLVVVDDDNGINTELAFNTDITQVVDIETRFNFGKLKMDWKLIRFTRENGAIWMQILREKSKSEWFRM